jgi:hypothetical protein
VQRAKEENPIFENVFGVNSLGNSPGGSRALRAGVSFARSARGKVEGLILRTNFENGSDR